MNENQLAGKKGFTLLAVITVILIFICDSFIPLGVAGGVPYILPILISLWVRSKKFTIGLSMVCSILTLFGLYSSPSGGELWKVLFNRSLALFAIWTCSLLTIKYFNQIIAQITLEKEIEKVVIYKKTLSGINHLVRNLLNDLQIINQSEALKEELGEDILNLLNQTSAETESILKQLGALDDISVETISKIAFSNVEQIDEDKEGEI